jgi:hypothetical protein
MSLKRRLAIPLFYALIASLALRTLLFRLTTHIPGQGVTDYYHFTWSYWWIRHALTTPGVSVWKTDYVFFPFVSNLSYHTLAPFWFPVWAALEPVAGLLTPLNVIAWLSLALTGIFTHYLLRREGVASGLALLGGVALEVTPLLFMTTWWLSISLMGVFWYPLHLLIWGQVARDVGRRWRGPAWAVAQGAALWGAALTDLQYPLFLALLLGPYALLTLVETRQRGRLIMLGALALIVFAALMWWAGPLPALLEADRSKMVEAEGGLIYRIRFPEGYLRVGEYWRHNSVGGLVMLALAVSLIAALIRRGDRRRWVWFAMIPIPLILSPGTEIVIGGATIPMPYRWLHEVMGGTFRSPGRLGPVFVLPALVFIGRVWTPILAHRPRLRYGAVGAGLLVLLAYHRVFAPFPVQPMPPIYDVYKMMGREPYQYVVVEVPVAAGDGVVTVGDPKDLAPMFYGAIHGKRMITGHLSRAPLDYFWYLRTDHPALSWLGQRRPLDPVLVEPELRRMIYEYPIGYIVIHRDAIGIDSPTNQEIIGYFNTLDDLLCPITVEGPLVVYRTAWHPDGCPAREPPAVAPGIYEIDIGSPGDELFLGWGWHWPESPPGVTWRWTGQYPQAELYVDLPPGVYDLTLAAQSFWRARELRVAVNDTPLGTVTVPTEGLRAFSFSVPADAVGTGRHVTVRLDYDRPDIPADVGQSADPRPLAVAVDWVRFARVAGR